MVQLSQPLMRQCAVVGIYDSNNKDYDAHYAYVSLETARDLFEMGNAVTGVEIRLHAIEDAEAVQRDLQDRLGEGYRVSTWYDLHRDLYSVMKIERWTAYIILCLIVGVATFNVLGSLTMGVIEKRRDIGILKALGATSGSITRLFMFEGMLVGTLGTLLGTGIGLLVCYLQITYQLFPARSDGVHHPGNSGGGALDRFPCRVAGIHAAQPPCLAVSGTPRRGAVAGAGYPLGVRAMNTTNTTPVITATDITKTFPDGRRPGGKAVRAAGDQSAHCCRRDHRGRRRVGSREEHTPPYSRDARPSDIGERVL